MSEVIVSGNFKAVMVSNFEYTLFGSNERIGDLLMDVDGFFYLNLAPNCEGYWSKNSLRRIADILEKLNKPINDSINKYFNNLTIKDENREY